MAGILVLYLNIPSSGLLSNQQQDQDFAFPSLIKFLFMSAQSLVAKMADIGYSEQYSPCKQAG